jgi:drug/metabolite transporter (DMT)-like permease
VSDAIYWALFFATSVYGHVALKVAVRRAPTGSTLSVLRSGFSWWGVTAYAAWGVSCLCWMLVLSRSGLLKASSISSLSYVFICASAILFLGDALTWPRAAGATLIAVGILLIR